MAKHQSPRRTKEQWSQIIQDQQDSSLTVAEYCKQNEIVISNFYAWKAKLKKTSEPHQASQDNNWLPLTFSSPQSVESNWHIELDLPGGVTLKMRPA